MSSPGHWLLVVDNRSIVADPPRERPRMLPFKRVLRSGARPGSARAIGPGVAALSYPAGSTLNDGAQTLGTRSAAAASDRAAASRPSGPAMRRLLGGKARLQHSYASEAPAPAAAAEEATPAATTAEMADIPAGYPAAAASKPAQGIRRTSKACSLPHRAAVSK